MDDVRFGVYLRPSYEMCQAQSIVHEILRRQYGLKAAGRFMPHVTIKGFFRSTATPQEIATAIENASRDRRAPLLYNSGISSFEQGDIFIDVSCAPAGEPNQELADLYRATMEQVLPLVHSDCDFTPIELEWNKAGFVAHLTLAMADLPSRYRDEVLGFLREAEPIGPPQFQAEVVQLFAFSSASWTGRWWESLEWELLNSWRLLR
jgi:2'-5' RNA ligase